MNEVAVDGVVMEGEVAQARALSSGHVEQPPTLESIAKQLWNISTTLQVIHQQRYEDGNETIAYINDI